MPDETGTTFLFTANQYLIMIALGHDHQASISFLTSDDHGLDMVQVHRPVLGLAIDRSVCVILDLESAILVPVNIRNL